MRGFLMCSTEDKFLNNAPDISNLRKNVQSQDRSGSIRGTHRSIPIIATGFKHPRPKAAAEDWREELCRKF